mmetsp:Transcript_19526/g.44650  ORF Transcript_19526/g.44650 Transcript_19526/m.44650 type:complete len:345 (+) Transcript_19526:124-1158(+)
MLLSSHHIRFQHEVIACPWVVELKALSHAPEHLFCLVIDDLFWPSIDMSDELHDCFFILEKLCWLLCPGVYECLYLFHPADLSHDLVHHLLLSLSSFEQSLLKVVPTADVRPFSKLLDAWGIAKHLQRAWQAEDLSCLRIRQAEELIVSGHTSGKPIFNSNGLWTFRVPKQATEHDESLRRKENLAQVVNIAEYHIRAHGSNSPVAFFIGHLAGMYRCTNRGWSDVACVEQISVIEAVLLWYPPTLGIEHLLRQRNSSLWYTRFRIVEEIMICSSHRLNPSQSCVVPHVRENVFTLHCDDEWSIVDPSTILHDFCDLMLGCRAHIVTTPCSNEYLNLRLPPPMA